MKIQDALMNLVEICSDMNNVERYLMEVNAGKCELKDDELEAMLKITIDDRNRLQQINETLKKEFKENYHGL